MTTKKTCELCKERPATILIYCSSCWEKHEPTNEELDAVINQQAEQLPHWWVTEQEKINEYENR